MDESTPLLNQHDTASQQRVSPIAIQINSIDKLTATDITSVLPDDCSTAFALVVLLHALSHRPTEAPAEPWIAFITSELATHNSRILCTRITDLWTSFLHEYRTRKEIHAVLWSKFYLDDMHAERDDYVRVVDYLPYPSSPSLFLKHPVVMSSLKETWVLGDPTFSPATIAQRFDSLATPRVVHFVSLCMHFAYLVLLCQFIMSTSQLDYPWRDYTLLSYSILSVMSIRSFRAAPFLLVAIAFALKTPQPGDSTFTAVLLAFMVHIYQDHLPNSSPNPLLLLSPERVLPLAHLQYASVAHTFMQAIAFFSPLFLILSFLISFSMADTFPPLWNAARLFGDTNAAPIETRVCFLLFFTVASLLFASFVFTLACAFPITCNQSSQHQVCQWDRYSSLIGLLARQTFVRAILLNSTYAYPFPFNIFDIGIPLGASFLPTWTPSPRIYIWRSTVGLVALPAAFVLLFLPKNLN